MQIWQNGFHICKRNSEELNIKFANSVRMDDGKCLESCESHSVHEAAETVKTHIYIFVARL